jgi:hypothetical protein
MGLPRQWEDEGTRSNNALVTQVDPEPAFTIGPGQAANSTIGSAPEFCTKNVPIFQDFGFGTNLLIYAQTHCGINA